MFTQCPDCNAWFRIGAEHLRSARGQVRCGRCHNTFDALASLCDRPPQPSPTETTNERSTTASLSATRPLDESHPEAAGELEREAEALLPQGPKGDLDRGVEIAQELEQFDLGVAKKPVQPRNRLAWGAGTATALIALLSQAAYFHWDAIAQHPQLRPWLDTACQSVGCALPPRRAPEMIQLIRRDIHSHRSRAGALTVELAVANVAPFQQAYPIIQVSLFETSGRLLAQRNFEPSEYMATVTTDRAGLSPGQTALIRLDLVDPGEEATGFEFNFL